MKELFGPEAEQLKGQIDHQHAEQATVSPICMWISDLMTFKNQLVSTEATSWLFSWDIYLFIKLPQR